MNFSRAMNQTINKLGLRKSDVAKATGYSHQHISDLLSGERRWNEDSINRVCEALGISIQINTQGGESNEYSQ